MKSASVLASIATFVSIAWSAPVGANPSAGHEARKAYHYVSFDEGLPSDLQFFDPKVLTNHRKVYGNGYYVCDVSCLANIVVWENGQYRTINENSFVYAVNEAGTAAGSKIVDVAAFVEQAAIFHDGREELIPRLPNEVASHVVQINNRGVAVVESVDATTFQATQYIYNHGRVLKLQIDSFTVADLNDDNLVTGIVFKAPSSQRAFLANGVSGQVTTFQPLSGDVDTWGQALNARGDVLGYSFTNGSTERIGYWRNSKFHTLFVEGTPTTPTISNQLLWNEEGLVVITRTSAPDTHSYLLPKSGVRRDLADLVDGPGVPPYTVIVDINDRGDLIGYGAPDITSVLQTFYLERDRGCDL